MSQNIQGTFVSQKVNKIRWRPDPFNRSHSFITGSWDQEQNSVKLWDIQESDETDLYPFVVSEIFQEGDITEALFINTDVFACSSSSGSVSLYKICYDNSAISIGELKKWKSIHTFQNDELSSCTSITNYDQDIVSVGEDGKINLLTLSSDTIVRKYENADSCSLKCVLFLKHNEILSSNLRGQMKMWDLRSRNEEPLNTFVLSDDMVAPTCLAHHPTQRYLVIAGDEEGSLTIWDLRKTTQPLNLLRAHEESISEIQFHPDYPNHLFSSSSSGEIWHWSMKPKHKSHLIIGTSEINEENAWFTSDSFKNKVEVFTLMDKLHKPINTFDIHQMKVIFGCDNEAIYLINGLNLHNL